MQRSREQSAAERIEQRVSENRKSSVRWIGDDEGDTDASEDDRRDDNESEYDWIADDDEELEIEEDSDGDDNQGAYGSTRRR